MGTIGVRRETKSPHERRVPLTPEHMASASREHGIRFMVQSSGKRIFSDGEYARAGIAVGKDLSDADIVLGVKEIPIDHLVPGQSYLFFSHTIKGQPYNMPMLRAMLMRGCSLLDYERFVDRDNRRVVFFGYHAGLAGMIDALWVLGRRLAQRGISTPFSGLHQAMACRDFQEASSHIAAAGRHIASQGLPEELTPLVIGFSGYGNVSKGAQFVSDLLPTIEVQPEHLAALLANPRSASREHVYKVVFREEHMFRRKDGAPFALQEYFDDPDRYESAFDPWLGHLTILANSIYWDSRYPRLVTRSRVRELHSEGSLRLEVIADITCDVGGSIELTTETTDQDRPILVYDPAADVVQRTWKGVGVAVLAVDNLPAEIPLDSSRHFSDSLYPFLPTLADLDHSLPFHRLNLPEGMQDAIIVWNGELTPSYQYLRDHL